MLRILQNIIQTSLRRLKSGVILNPIRKHQLNEGKALAALNDDQDIAVELTACKEQFCVGNF